MARLSVANSEVQALVERLAPLMMGSGNVAKLVRRLNEVLAANGETRRLHANRLTALLSDDAERGVNEATLSLLRSALDLLPTSKDDDLAGVRGRAQGLIVQGADLAATAEALGVPKAIVRVALDGHAPMVANVSQSASTGAPDWSYQEVAVARTLDAFRRRPAGRIGLVLPTGAGKTRIGLRIVLERLAAAPPTARVVWVTHRKTLKRQAFRQLGKLLETKTPLPENADRLANRIIFAMVGEIEELVTNHGGNICLIVIDEAHHAAAPSYRRIFEPRLSCPVLLLTATPNRPDALPIGVEEIAFTITYRELAERNVILIPEFIPFPVPNFDWNEETLDDLIDWVVDETSDRFRKVLILAPRVERVEEFYDRLIHGLQHEVDHPLALEDVGYIHGGGNSLLLPDEDFLERFEDKPRGILVSAQMLLEGFDDPAIDTVVLTYSTSSVIRLMQAAGRCVRYHSGKTKAYVVQADNADLEYRFDQRWLYQELDDYLRPEIVDCSYVTPSDRRVQIENQLNHHNVSGTERAAVLRQVDALSLGDDVRLFFFGKPYFGAPEDFWMKSSWGVFVETPANSDSFRQIFNRFSISGARLSDPTDFLLKYGPALGVTKDLSPGSLWRQLGLILTAAYCAQEELYGAPSYGLQGKRPRVKKGPTSWLRYATFSFHPRVPQPLADFLADCHNRQALEESYLDAPEDFAAALKIPLPLGGTEGLWLKSETLAELELRLASIAATVRLAAPGDRFAALAAEISTGKPLPLPLQFSARIEHLLGGNDLAQRLYKLNR